MIKKTIAYADFDGVERTEDSYFNLTEAELIKMETSVEGGMSAMLDKMIKSPNPTEIIPIIDKIVDAAYGVKSPDGRRFMKTRPDGSRYVDDFKETLAYSEFYTDLFLNPVKAAEFFNSLIPEKLKEKLDAAGSLPAITPTAE